MLQESGDPGLHSAEPRRALGARGRRPQRRRPFRFVDRWLLEEVELGVRLPQEMELVRQAEEGGATAQVLDQSDLNVCSRGCRGCTSITAGPGRQFHSEGCRQRLEIIPLGPRSCQRQRRPIARDCSEPCSEETARRMGGRHGR